ncbi:MAG: 7-cyano-7-deazaguanine synthase QueC [Pseudomonadota bacterium]
MKKLNPDHALVLFSGGQDSSIVLAWALERFARVDTVGFSYGQRHRVELDARAVVRSSLAAFSPDWGESLGRDNVLDLSGFGASLDTALTSDAPIGFDEEAGLPTTFVPGRNLVFLTMAAGLAYNRNAGVLAAGMCEEDATGYPDCRRAALDAQVQALCLGLDADLRLETPVLEMSKARSWALAERIGGRALVDLINVNSHTCYIGDRTAHDWGFGCGECPACKLRAEGWARYISSSQQR